MHNPKNYLSNKEIVFLLISVSFNFLKNNLGFHYSSVYYLYHGPRLLSFVFEIYIEEMMVMGHSF